jgi:hypothetical protein
MMNIRKSNRSSIILAGVVAFACGCSQSEPKGTSVVAVMPSASAPTNSSQPPTKSPPVSVALLSAAKAQAEAFLKLLPVDVAGASAKIAIPFKKQVTDSLTYEEEKKLGYSESDTQKYLKKASDGVTQWELRTVVAGPNGTDFSLRGEAVSATGPAQFAVRLANSGDAWQVTRFAVARIAKAAPSQPNTTFEQIWVREAALDFLDAFVGGDSEHVLTMAIMTPAFKKRVSEKFPADAGLGYSKKGVRDWLNELRLGTTGYEINTHSDNSRGQLFTGQLFGAAKPVAFMLIAVKDADGNWVIDNLMVR